MIKAISLYLAKLQQIINPQILALRSLKESNRMLVPGVQEDTMHFSGQVFAGLMSKNHDSESDHMHLAYAVEAAKTSLWSYPRVKSDRLQPGQGTLIITYLHTVHTTIKKTKGF